MDRYKAWGKWLDEYRSQLKAEGRSDEERRREQDAVNPCYVPRNQVMQEVIKDAEAGNYEGVSIPVCEGHPLQRCCGLTLCWIYRGTLRQWDCPPQMPCNPALPHAERCLWHKT